MKYKSIASPEPSEGTDFTKEKKAVVPNMALSLEEILRRFTRGEPLEIGRVGASYDDGPEDLEKIQHMDMVDRAEYSEKFGEIKKAYDRQEKKRAKDEKARLDNLAVEKLAADKLALEQKAK